MRNYFINYHWDKVDLNLFPIDEEIHKFLKNEMSTKSNEREGCSPTDKNSQSSRHLFTQERTLETKVLLSDSLTILGVLRKEKGLILHVY